MNQDRSQDGRTQRSTAPNRTADWLDIPTFAKTADDLLRRANELTQLRRTRLEPLLDFLRRDIEAKKPQRVIHSVLYGVLEALDAHHKLQHSLLRACEPDSLTHCTPGAQPNTQGAMACVLICDHHVKPPPPHADPSQYAAPPADYTAQVLRRIEELVPNWINEIPEDWAQWVARTGLPAPARGPQTIPAPGNTAQAPPLSLPGFHNVLDLTRATPSGGNA